MALASTQFAQKIIGNIEKVVVGKRGAVSLLAIATLCDGHALIEDVPGVAKTILVNSLAISLGCKFTRIQCTPDLLPTDVTGVTIFNQKSSEFEFHPGPVFSQFILADELNRATPRTQSALLEAMAEKQVTVDGVTRPLNRPFMVVATQNPIEHEGTFPLPEAQLDRFLMRISVGYPSLEHERTILEQQRRQHPIRSLQKISSADELLAVQEQIKSVHLHASVQDYLLRIVHATRTHPDLALGASPRGSLNLYRAAQAFATLDGRDYVIPDDIKILAPAVLAHRLIVKPESRLKRRTPRNLIEEILQATPAPVNRPDWRQ
ncbi:MoxR family ATPase [Candidatus Poribacteria bacterium]|nr:MoxR family ATPase [Candidatus Poribacteria bacterium]